MKPKLILGLVIFLVGEVCSLFGAGLPTFQANPLAIAHEWEYITFQRVSPDDKENPVFWVGFDHRGKESLGLRLDIRQGPDFFKTNDIVARLYRANGETVEPTISGKKLLAFRLAANGTTDVLTYFPWGPNTLNESWIEISIGRERYCLEIPYGFDRNPTDSLPASVPSGPPRLFPNLSSFGKHDHLVPWKEVRYDLGRTQDGFAAALLQSNPFDAKSDVQFYSLHGLYSPHSAVQILDADARPIAGRCVNLNLADDHERTDTFAFNRNGDDLRCWGRIEVAIDNVHYRVVVPSSLNKYTHGHG